MRVGSGVYEGRGEGWTGASRSTEGIVKVALEF